MSSANDALFKTLSPDQVTELEKLAGANYSPESIAMYLDVASEEFLLEWNDTKSKIRYHYDRGQLLITAKAEMCLGESAAQGNITAYQEYKKAQYFRKLENFKLKQRIDSDLRDIDNLQRLMAQGDPGDMSAEQQLHYEILDFIRRLSIKYESKNFIINALLKSYPAVVKGRRKATQLYSDAINFFYSDNDITQSAWCNKYADEYDSVAALCLEAQDFDNYTKLKDKAAKLRGCFKETINKYPEEFYRKQNVLYVFDPKLTKIKRVDRKVVKEYINNLPDLREEDIKLLHRDNLTEDVEFELIPTPDED